MGQWQEHEVPVPLAHLVPVEAIVLEKRQPLEHCLLMRRIRGGNNGIPPGVPEAE